MRAYIRGTRLISKMRKRKQESIERFVIESRMLLILERDEKNYTIFRLIFGLESITRFEESLLLISLTVGGLRCKSDR